MPYNYLNEDLRSIKTEKALYTAIISLLKKQNFKKITVKGICEEALISRAAFYAHFIDKYDLLEQYLKDLWSKNITCYNSYEQLEQAINSRINECRRILRNLFNDADNETFETLTNFLLYTKNMNTDKSVYKDTHHKNIVSTSFYAGGIISYLLWQIKNEFPPDVPLINKIFYQMIIEPKDWLPK